MWQFCWLLLLLTLSSAQPYNIIVLGEDGSEQIIETHADPKVEEIPAPKQSGNLISKSIAPVRAHFRNVNDHFISLVESVLRVKRDNKINDITKQEVSEEVREKIMHEFAHKPVNYIKNSNVEEHVQTRRMNLDDTSKERTSSVNQNEDVIETSDQTLSDDVSIENKNKIIEEERKIFVMKQNPFVPAEIISGKANAPVIKVINLSIDDDKTIVPKEYNAVLIPEVDKIEGNTPVVDNLYPTEIETKV